MQNADGFYRALASRDPRFDGIFYVGVSTTGIYCRPICSARTPGRDRCTFFASPAAAEKAGFRACFRCRPELAPGRSHQDALPRLVSNAVDRIEQGFLNEHDVDRLASELGVTGRHLRRAMARQIGVTPVELAQSRRLALAKRLLQDTRLGLAEVAFASGFQSVRRFNALFRARFDRSPSDLRRQHGTAEPAPRTLSLRLDYRPPLELPALLAFLRDRAIPGVERVAEGSYRRVVEIDGQTGTVAVGPDPQRPALWVNVSLSLLGVFPPQAGRPAWGPRLMKLAARLRHLFDLDAQPHAIAEVLLRDPRLAPLVRRRPGLRVPGSLDPFETTVRAVLGQQVSVRAATTLAGRLAARFGRPIQGEDPLLTHRFPTAAELARAPVEAIAAIGLPRARAQSVQAVAAAFAAGGLDLDDPEALTAQLVALPGIGPWTASYVAMRAARQPDAFPASDLGIRRALGNIGAREAEARSQRWRPFRSYAVLHLWTSLPAPSAPSAPSAPLEGDTR
jgi:AraC family transcriptional regulator, regulatory protein of adaptative response / DNA-3-methyladenine glycosylase II